MEPDAEEACHELLLRLAGRLSDELLWRYRDWLSEGALSTLARTLPKSLLKYRIDLDEQEYYLLAAGLVPHGADRNQVSSTLGVDEPAPNGYTFTSNAPERVKSVDSVTAILHAALRGRPEVGEVRESWRHDGAGGATEQHGSRRVLLVTARSGQTRLAGELQRVLRVLGDEQPSVEVLPAGRELPEYHRAALAQSELVCVGALRTGEAAPGEGLVPA